jgi:hypothetical protein
MFEATGKQVAVSGDGVVSHSSGCILGSFGLEGGSECMRREFFS